MRKRTAKLTKIEALESHSSPNPSNSQNSHREPNGDPENPHIQTGKWSRREYFLFYQCNTDNTQTISSTGPNGVK